MQKVVTYGQTPTVDVSKIPDSEAAHLARATLRAVTRYFEIPGVKEEYEAWLVEYKKRKAVAV